VRQSLEWLHAVFLKHIKPDARRSDLSDDGIDDTFVLDAGLSLNRRQEQVPLIGVHGERERRAADLSCHVCATTDTKV
jgi:hypothetical protein